MSAFVSPAFSARQAPFTDSLGYISTEVTVSYMFGDLPVRDTKVDFLIKCCTVTEAPNPFAMEAL